MANKFNIDPDISKAETLPASFYKDESIFESVKEQVFLKSWQWIGDENLVPLPHSVHPFVLLDSYLTEPMLLTRDTNDEINCLTNVCTHRGNLMRLKIFQELAMIYINFQFVNGVLFYLLDSIHHSIFRRLLTR